MTNSRASSGKIILLDHHLATGTESTYTYTPSTALTMKILYREIMIIITGKATAAFSLQLKVNAATNYDNAQIFMDTTTVSGAVDTDTTEFTIIASSLIDGATTFMAKVSIILNDAADLLIMSSLGSAPHEGLNFRVSENQTGATTITAINTATSTSTWIAGTEISTYGLLR